MTTLLDIEALKAKAEKATAGPWGWYGNMHDLYLATTNRGRQYVMGFRRMRTQSAQPVFRKGERLVPAADLVLFEVGDGAAIGFAAGKADNSVYRYDVNGIDAPDAEYIAAANPSAILELIAQRAELLKAVKLAVDLVERDVIRVRPSESEELIEALTKWNAAISRATQSTGEGERDDSEDWYCEAQLEEIARKERGEV